MSVQFVILKKLAIVLIFLSVSGVLFSQPLAPDVKWYSFAQALELCKQKPRKIMVDVYTDWCGWCKRMDATTYKNPSVIHYLNTYYYPVKFNAEQREDIIIGKDTFQFVSNGSRGYHELAAVLLNYQLGYPSTTFINEKLQMVAVVPGYLPTERMMAWMEYIVTDQYINLPPQQFSQELDKRMDLNGQ